MSILLLISVISLSSLAQGGFSPQTQARLQAVLATFQNDPNNPVIGGISAAIKVDELALWQGVTGYAARNVDVNNNLLPGGTPLTTSTVFQIYSVTKTFTAALVLELAREGAFSLDDPVSKFIPLSLINPQLSSAVTIRQLLAHESGYSDYTTEVQLQIAVAFDPVKIWTPQEVIYFTHQVSVPGAERRYSSTNYIILGAIIEVVTGKPVEQLYRERFFNPLGLRSMYLSVREPLPPGTTLAAPHDTLSKFNPIFQLTQQPTFPDAYTNVSSFSFNGITSLAFTGGGIVSNAADLAEWGNALFGGRATSRSTLDQMLNSISPVADPDGDRLGYGIFTNTKISKTEFFVGHNGSAPGYRSVMFYQPDRKMTIVVLTNFSGVNPYAIAKALFEALPDFLCGNENRKENKILVCSKGKDQCIARTAARGFMQKGAYLGACEEGAGKKGNGLTSAVPYAPGIHLQEATLSNGKLTIYPNPSSNMVNFSFSTTQSGRVHLGIYNTNGQLLATVVDKNVEKSVVQQVYFNAGKLPAGTYITRLQTANGISQQKMILTP
jgi:D-alanyl-D-alanine carboxypeptidase